MIASVQLRKLVREDAPQYHAFRTRQLRAHPTSFTSAADEEEARSESWAADRIASPERPDDLIIGAFDAGRLVGIAGLSIPSQRQARHKATLFGMAVDDDYAGHGIGRALVERVLAKARAIPGTLQVVLTVS